MSARFENFDPSDGIFCIDCGESHCDDPHYTADNEGPYCTGCFEAYDIMNAETAND